MRIFLGSDREIFEESIENLELCTMEMNIAIDSIFPPDNFMGIYHRACGFCEKDAICNSSGICAECANS